MSDLQGQEIDAAVLKVLGYEVQDFEGHNRQQTNPIEATIMTPETLQSYCDTAAEAGKRAARELGESQYSQRTLDLYDIVRLADAVVELAAEVERLQIILKEPSA